MSETVATMLARFIENMSDWSRATTDWMSTSGNSIPKMQWELAAANTLAISHSEFRYVFSFFLSLLAGAGINLFRKPTLRYLYAMFSGIFLVVYPFGNGVRQVILPALLTYSGMLTVPRHCGVLAWMACFPYLIWLVYTYRISHIINASQVKWNQGELDFVACDMVLVLKLIGVAVCYQDSFKKEEDLKPGQVERKLPKLPTVLEYVSFIFCLGNLLGGPFLEFKEFKQFMENEGVWASRDKPYKPSGVRHGFYLLAQSLCFMGSHILLVPKWGMGNIFSDYYNSSPLMGRLLQQVLCGFASQMKYYFVWKLAESSLTFAGLNLLRLEEDGKAVWGRCENINFLGVWLADNPRQMPQYWNIATSTFLRRYVYERVSPKKGKPTIFHVLITQLTSAIWHGLYPGYMIFFVNTVFWLNMGSVLYKTERQSFFPSSIRTSPIWWFFKVVWVDASLTLLAMSFLALDMDKSFAIAADVYFIPYIIMIAFALLGLLLPKLPCTTPKVQVVGRSAPAEKKEK